KVPGIFYKVILWLLFIEPISYIFLIQHYPGATEMAFLVSFGTVLFAGALIYNGLAGKAEWSPHPFYLCGFSIGTKAVVSLIGGITGGPVAIGMLSPSGFESPLVLFLFIAALLLKLKEKNLQMGMDKILNLFLLRSGIMVAANLIWLGGHFMGWSFGALQ
ncbi:MAG: hypothetical protein ABEH43_03820, partial [Flavobacteriales bacterium]